MIYKYDLVYQTKFGYVFQLNNLVKRDKFDIDYIYTYLYSKFYFFNNRRIKRKYNIDFNSLINNNIMIFNLNFFLELNEILLEDDLGLTEVDLLQEYLLYNLIKKFNYNNKIFNVIINDLFFKSLIDFDILE